ncbi:Spatacsin [Dorcoceras hygrometricum]|uniref:Spatacsin n=1 Tax=Dorcoceras hygrometricum TaxID=472368 RepID=A0A2Z7ALU6_9LAMI|nr:Spatacsin [Dorcoceras hygrometricum]
MDKSRYVETHLHIDDDNNLQFMLDTSNEIQCIELFIGTKPIDRHAPIDDHGSYIPCITQGFNSMGFNSVGFNQDASTSAIDFHVPTDQNRYTSEHDTVSRGNRHFTIDGGRLRQSGPRPDTRLLRQPALEGLTRSARTDSPRQVGRNKFRRRRRRGGAGVRFEERGAAPRV